MRCQLRCTPYPCDVSDFSVAPYDYTSQTNVHCTARMNPPDTRQTKRGRKKKPKKGKHRVERDVAGSPSADTRTSPAGTTPLIEGVNECITSANAMGPAVTKPAESPLVNPVGTEKSSSPVAGDRQEMGAPISSLDTMKSAHDRTFPS